MKRESIAIIGTSGSGKSTLLNILSSLLEPKSGEILFENQNIYKIKKNKLLNIRREDFGIIFQAHYLFRGFSANDNLEIATLLSGNDIDKSLLKKLNIDFVINQSVGELSGGQQQRLCKDFLDMFILHLEFKGLKKQYEITSKKIEITMNPPSRYDEQMEQMFMEDLLLVHHQRQYMVEGGWSLTINFINISVFSPIKPTNRMLWSTVLSYIMNARFLA